MLVQVDILILLTKRPKLGDELNHQYWFILYLFNVKRTALEFALSVKQAFILPFLQLS